MTKTTTSLVFRALRNPKMSQFSHYRQVWGQQWSVNSDDVRKVKVPLLRLDEVIFCTKSCMIIPSSVVVVVVFPSGGDDHRREASRP